MQRALKLPLLLPALAGLVGLAACASRVEAGQCEALQKQVIPLTLGTATTTEPQLWRDLNRLAACGFDTARVGYVGPILGTLLLRKLNAGQKPEVTYGELLAEIDKAHLELMPPKAAPPPGP